MLDAFIIRRIQQEREKRDAGFVPLRVEIPAPDPVDDTVPSSSTDVGITIVDNRIES